MPGSPDSQAAASASESAPRTVTEIRNALLRVGPSSSEWTSELVSAAHDRGISPYGAFRALSARDGEPSFIAIDAPEPATGPPRWRRASSKPDEVQFSYRVPNSSSDDVIGSGKVEIEGSTLLVGFDSQLTDFPAALRWLRPAFTQWCAALTCTDVVGYTSTEQHRFAPTSRPLALDDLPTGARRSPSPEGQQQHELERSLCTVLTLGQADFDPATRTTSWWVEGESSPPWCLSTTSVRLELRRGILVGAHTIAQLHDRLPHVPLSELSFDDRSSVRVGIGQEAANADSMRGCITYRAAHFDPQIAALNPITPKLSQLRHRVGRIDSFDLVASDLGVHEFAHLAVDFATRQDCERVLIATHLALGELGASLPAWWVLGGLQGATPRTYIALIRTVGHYATNDVHEAMADMASHAELSARPHPAITNWWNTIIDIVGGDPSSPKLAELTDA